MSRRRRSASPKAFDVGGRMPDPTSIESLRSLLGASDDALARLGAPLWARVGRSLRIGDLSWARSFGSEDAPQIVCAEGRANPGAVAFAP